MTMCVCKCVIITEQKGVYGRAKWLVVKKMGCDYAYMAAKGVFSFSQENPNQLWLKPFDSPMYCVSRGSMSQWEETVR